MHAEIYFKRDKQQVLVPVIYPVLTLQVMRRGNKYVYLRKAEFII